MHPDVMIAALRAELDELKRSPEPDADREKEIEQQIAAYDEQPRPVALPDSPETVYDHDRAYRDALEAELAEAERGNEPPVRGVDAKDRVAEIKEEIARVEAKLGADDSASEDDEDLSKLKREELNELAESLGVENPAGLGKKEDVLDAIAAARENA